MAYYAGIDPGIKGGFALIDGDSKVIGTWKTPLDKRRKFCPHETWKLIKEIDAIAANDFEEVVCCIEGLLSLPSDTAKIKELFASYELMPRTCIADEIKKQLAMTDGRVGSVTMGKNFGILVGQIAAIGWRYIEASPRTWQSATTKGMPGPTAKIRAYNFVKSIFPDVDVSKRGGGFDDAITDCLSIAEYARRTFKL